MKKKLGNPDNHCPICDKPWSDRHRCSVEDLATLDAVHQTDPNMGIVMTMPIGLRISEGFRLMGMSED
jgi:hypothetical protein